MQYNYANPLYENPGCNIDPFNFGKPPPYPQIIGEGDVASVIYPDGTVQLYFIPANRRPTVWPRYPINSNFPYSNNLNFNANPDVFIVRSISHPFTTSCCNRTIPNVYGDQLQPVQFNSNFWSNCAPCQYYQKFHNDNCTSTTDIKYYYPKLNCNIKLRYSVEVQTEPIRICDIINTNEEEVHCCCKSQDVRNLRKERKNICRCSESSTSYMSIDSAGKSKHKLRKQKKNKKKTKKSKSNICECHDKTKLDKSVTTYADCACGSAVKDGTHTQTNKKNTYSNCACDRPVNDGTKKKNTYSDCACDRPVNDGTNKNTYSDCACDRPVNDGTKKKNTYSDCACDRPVNDGTNKNTYSDCACDRELNDGTNNKNTYTHCACDRAIKDWTRRHTNKKNKSKRKDIKTEVWVPFDSSWSSSSLRICESAYSYGKCSCDSTSDVEGR